MSNAKDKDPIEKDGTENTDDNKQFIKQRTLAVLVGVLAFGFLTVFLHATTANGWTQGFSFFAVESTVWAACALAGGLLGFLFGYPRTPDTAGISARANTNLEQISDWLTKGLLGIGLTQVNVVPQKLYEISSFIATSTGGTPNAQVFAQVLIVFTLTTGFLIGFLWSRLYLVIAFERADRATWMEVVDQKLKKQKEEQLDQKKLDSQLKGLVERQLNPSQDMMGVSQDELDAAVLAASSATRAEIYYHVSAFRKENWNVKAAKMSRTIPVFRALIASDTKGEYHKNHGQLGFALKDMPDPDLKGAVMELTEAIRMRDAKHERGWLFYDLSRATCRIWIDAGGKNPPVVATSPQVRDEIIGDLLAFAVNDELKRVLWRETDLEGNPMKDYPVPAWTRINNVTEPDLKEPERPT